MAKVADVAHTHSFYRYWVYFRSSGVGVIFEIWANFKIAIFEYGNWLFAKVTEAAHTLCFTSRGEMCLFWLYGQQFPRYGPIFINAKLDMKIDKCQKLHMYHLICPQAPVPGG